MVLAIRREGIAILYFFSVPLIVITALSIMAALTNFLWFDPPAELDRLKPQETLGESFPVRVTLFDRNYATGTDWAYSTFLDGWLLFEGLRTSFSLRAVDVERLTTLDRKGCLLTLLNGQQIRITPYSPDDRTDLSFREAARIWHHFIIESPEGDPVLPPRTVHGSATTRPVGQAMLSTLFALVGIVITVFAQTTLGSIVLVVGIASFVAAMVNLRNLTRTKILPTPKTAIE